ncbi:MAG: molybdopterin-guanine dinucleotide biosynthesis protein B [Proteobacteria bacterium]|nr:molybdopterin-guanine dinucleotide biosynthesis protein B [Pseudomonadota bacterium]MBI3496302.1 molybdopterin-guanine dinucleotide biosynthesis protein B [Pseudomonadota bacterium]
MKILGIAGWSGSGKTTLVAKLLPELIAAGLRVSTLKHAHHAFDIDRPGKDSYVHRMAGATEVMVGSANRWALMHELRGAAEPSMGELVARMSPVDLLLVEGFKRDGHDKLEVFRRANGKPLLAPEDDRVVAVASDGAVPEVALPILDLNDVPAIARFVIRHTGLA